MPNFESPIGNKSFNAARMRNIEVPDETEYQGGQQHTHSQVHHYGQSVQVPQINEASIREFQARANPEFERSEADIEKEIRDAREFKRSGREKISEGAKRRIEILLGMIQSNKTINIEGTSFTIRTLKSKEMRDAIFIAAKFDGTIEAPYEIRRQLLARAITHVADIEIEQFIGGNTLEQKLMFLDELDDSFLSRLYAEYVSLASSVRDKYAIKNEDDLKEVVEEIKK